jgi:hypothetical protein
MDWMQFSTLLTTIITTFAAGGYALHSFLRGDIKEFRQEMRDDMKALDDKFDRRMIALEERFDRRMEAFDRRLEVFEEKMMFTDEKWERLFERLLIQDQART